jgi:DNA-binding GntR family transcriptional regulator
VRTRPPPLGQPAEAPQAAAEVFAKRAAGRHGGKQGGHLTDNSLSHRVYQALKRDIINCRLRPGSVVNEGELARTYGSSKTPIREALQSLSREGLVQIIPRRGILIAAVDIQAIQQTYFLRALLEPAGAALAAERATAEQIRKLRDLNREAQAGSDRSGAAFEEQAESNLRFHAAVAEASGMPRLAEIVASLGEDVVRFYASRGQWGFPLHQHDELVEAIVAGDAPQAHAVMAESIRVSRRRLIEALLDDSGLSPALEVVEPSA